MSTEPELIRALRRARATVTPEAQLRAALDRGESLNVKLGVDPTRADLHLGHLITLRLAGLFARHGHRVTLIIGDLTARIGDPTGRVAERPPLSDEDVTRNAEAFLTQIRAILPDVTVVRNSELQGHLGVTALLTHLQSVSAAALLQREDFRERLAGGERIGLNELLYPALQGLDSVLLNSDVELGGHDQLLNLMVGRDLQRSAGRPGQVAVTAPLLLGAGGKKMSKSLGNDVALSADADALFAGLMRLPDEAMDVALRGLTDYDEAAIAALISGHPRQAHLALARALTTELRGAAQAALAEERFEARAQRRAHDAPVAQITPGTVVDALVQSGLCESRSAARRMVSQNAVRLNAAVVVDPHWPLSAEANGAVLSCGRRSVALQFSTA